jgi:hypothetical protein
MDEVAASPLTQGNNHQISDVDYRLIGLSPQYWSYTRLSIGDLNALPLINGVDCFIAPRRDDGTESHQQQRSHHQWRILPLSRVLLRGVVTAIDRRPNGCTLVVIDDGSGSIDCRCWDDLSSSSAFHLPALLPQHKELLHRNGLRYDIGDSVEVMGKIKTLTAGNSASSIIDTGDTTPLDVRFGCIREIHATSVCVINGRQSISAANVWNGEAVHWLKCIHVENEIRKRNSTIKNGKEVLSLLGEKLSPSILSDGDSTSIGKKNILSRQCCQTPQRFRQAFFYCHCEATLVALDPTFYFRDSVLNHLLNCESQIQDIESCWHRSATEDCMDLFGAEANSIPPPILFTFQSICNDDHLSSIARNVVSSTNFPDGNLHRLLRRTFAAMTKDGLLSLYDPAEDLYLLVSCKRVLEPYLKRSKGMDDGGFVRPTIPEPFFIRSVPRKRLNELAVYLAEAE